MPGKLWPTLFGEKKVIQYIWRSARLETKPAFAAGTVLFFVFLLAALIVSVFTLQNQPAELSVPPATIEGAVRIVEIPAHEQVPAIKPAPPTENVYQSQQAEEGATGEKPAAIRPGSAELPANNMLANGVPANGVPANNVPVNGVPANGVPANGVPANNVPVNNVPANNMPENTETQTGQKEQLRNLLSRSPAAEFGWQFNKTYQDWRFYPGVDLYSDEAQIISFAGGQVADVVDGGESGLTVIVTSGQYEIYYATLKSVFLQKGAAIAAGDPVGVAGKVNGEATYRFHLRVHSNATGKYINPLEVLPL